MANGVLDGCMTYHDICEKHDLLRDCLKNDYVQNWHMKNFFGSIEENKGIVPTSYK